jgi:hypothetical protein
LEGGFVPPSIKGLVKTVRSYVLKTRRKDLTLWSDDELKKVEKIASELEDAAQWEESKQPIYLCEDFIDKFHK